MEIRYRAGDPLVSHAEVALGQEIRITLEGSEAYGWSAPVASGSLVLLDVGESQGTVTARALAGTGGEGELRAASSFRGDRFGPQTRLWRLRVHVTERL
ncbi:hypothetical protein ABIA32_000476 [Streptacidiphilus sp. MAP12-20]|uniref:hypothetical protein n=1 Tax=Streptacidiphilus sp. MAP12-20 TaxID=3156299 RepID=UPI0035166995